MGVFDSLKDQSKKLADKAKDEYKRQQTIAEQLSEERGKRLAKIPSIKYLGGHEQEKQSTGSLTFYENVIEFGSFTQPRAIVLKRPDVNNIAVEGKSEVSKRVTVTRLLAVGIFALAFKKKSEEKEAFITIVLDDGREVVFHTEMASPSDMKKKLSSVISKFKHAAKEGRDSQSGQQDYIEELKKLSTLKDQGVISSDEFEAKKKSILGL